MNPNLPTIIALVATAIVLSGVIAVMIVRRKKGKTSCSCGCSGCAMREMCHSNEKSKSQKANDEKASSQEK